VTGWIATKLPNAHQIAQARTADMPVETARDKDMKMLAYIHEVQNAAAELRRGEWVLPEEELSRTGMAV
jgi:hypothetical protein